MMTEAEKLAAIQAKLRGEKSTNAWHKRHADWARSDRIEIEAVPRYKTSGMSGDEWRVGYRVRVFFKGALVQEFWRTGLDYAVAHLKYEMDHFADNGLGSGFLAHEDSRCDQVGCDREAVTTLGLKEEFSSNGHKLDPSELHGAQFRRFCLRHLKRGDCGREDSDANYFHVAGPTEPRAHEEDESPSVLRPIIDLRGATND